MRVVKPIVTLLSITPDAEKLIERAGRVCYKSEDKITEDSAQTFIKMLIRRGHESVLEHAVATMLIVTDRGISHEIVRHRIASYSQESTRYCAYRDEIEVIEPSGLHDPGMYATWRNAMTTAEKKYKFLLLEVSSQVARSVLPTCTKTELVMTANSREWRHFLKLRLAKAAHPDMRIIAAKIHDILAREAPVVFGDVG